MKNSDSFSRIVMLGAGENRPDAWYFAMLNMIGVSVMLVACILLLQGTFAPIPAGHHFAVGTFAIETLCALTLPMTAVWVISRVIEEYRKRRGIRSDAHDEHNEVPLLVLKSFAIILLPVCLVFWGLFMMFHFAQ